MENKFGIVQGRLTLPPGGELQWFPQGKWEFEFEKAKKLGLNFVELLFEREDNLRNPLWTKEGREKIISLSKKNNIEILSYCTDYIISNNIFHGSTLEHTFRVIDIGSELGMEKLVLPFFESSEITNANFRDFKEVLDEIVSRTGNNNMVLCLETNLRGSELIQALDYYNHPQIGCVFDTGNRVAFGHNIYDDIILLGDYINHIHIKDKNKDNVNVILGAGLVKFYEVFKSLRKINYNGTYTFETTRGKNPEVTAKFNLSLSKYYLNEVQ